MTLEMDNKGAINLADNWSVGGRTRHVDVRNFFLGELKDEGLLVIKHVPGEENDADIFTKTLQLRYLKGTYPCLSVAMNT